MRKVVIGQAGGPTAVINATLAGVTEKLKETSSLIFMSKGYDGLCNGDFIEGNSEVVDWVLSHKNIPGACLGSGRYPMNEGEIFRCVQNLKKIRADTLVVIGGNGTMDALDKIQMAAEELKYELQVIGLPKTVDNDLGLTDHSPGFASAARYVAQSTLDMSRDLYAMRNFEQVRILETMGRNTGWLAAASGLFRDYEEDGPHFIAIPEKKLDKNELFEKIEHAVAQYGCAVVVTSEGVIWESEETVNRKIVQGRTVLGGVSTEIESAVQSNLGLTARSELLGMNQRSSLLYASKVDQREAYELGVEGGEWIAEGVTGVMTALQRTGGFRYNVDKIPVALKEVACHGERRMPSDFVSDLNAYYDWLKPLIGKDAISYPSPIPRREKNARG